MPLPAFADAVAPGLLVAQAIGRFGNWFNNELYGGPTDLPWALKIYQWDGGKAGRRAPDGHPVVPRLLPPDVPVRAAVELAAAAFVIWADRRFRLGHGRAFASTSPRYCLGRLWVELLRTDPAEHFFGIRINVFTAIMVGLGAVAYLIYMRGRPREVITRGAEERRRSRRRPGRPEDRTSPPTRR